MKASLEVQRATVVASRLLYHSQFDSPKFKPQLRQLAKLKQQISKHGIKL